MMTRSHPLNDHLLTEQEQIQQLKSWLKNYGPTILLGIIIALLLSTGWRYWQYHKTKVSLHASSIYDEMLTARAQNNSGETLNTAKKLLDHYASTPYASMASLMLARDAVLKKNYPEAIKQLEWVINHADNRALRQIARLREARILITQKNPQLALSLLGKINDKTFMGLIDEVKGDAYLAMNNKLAAQKSYGSALTELPNAEVTRPILQMKYDNLTTDQIT